MNSAAVEVSLNKFRTFIDTNGRFITTAADKIETKMWRTTKSRSEFDTVVQLRLNALSV
jgi:hypothetical protein